MKLRTIFYIFIGFFLLTSSCGPSPEQIAAMTASAWTPTPPPTATATPVPYDVNVSVVDESGAPIAGASVIFPESGNGEPVQSDAQGKFSWTNLAGEAATFKASAQGYFPTEQAATLQRGGNEVSVTLKRDPLAILPSEACAPGQNVLYVEDFQDGKAQGWPTISLGVDGDMPNGWSLLDENGNKILLHGNAPSPTNDEFQEHVFNNFVWHLKYKVIGNDADMFFMWRMSHEPEKTKRYVIAVGARSKPWMIRFLDTPAGPNPMNTGEASAMLKEDQWYNFDVAYFEGTHQIWLDGKMIMEYKDPQPYPEGAIGFETHLDQSKTTQFFMDDLVVCELTAPYAPTQ